MSAVARILYLQPFEFFGDINFLTESFLRISNYLNSRKSELEGKIEEEYLDLRIEGLPKYYPENIENYRKNLRDLLINLYERFRFNIVAISCYTSFTYLNSVEVAWMIKHYINPQCHIIVGGFHPSVLPKDFYPKNIPSYFNEYYPQKTTPFDYLVIDEGEIPFFYFIRDAINGTITTRKNLRERPIILEKEIMKNLDDLPLIDLNLFKKYKEIINKREVFYISFNRGCLYKCKFCPTSENYMKSYQMVRFKSMDKSIAELKKIINTEWLSIKKLKINDPIFFPKKSQRKQFFNELEKLNNKYDEIPFQIFIFDRIELCSLEDLKYYKKYDIIPGFGLETGSSTLLCRLGKFLDEKNNSQKAKKYLKKAKKLIKQANKLDTHVDFLCMGAAPGSDRQTIKENSNFFLKRRFLRKALIKKYKVNLQFEKFALFPGCTFYEKGEEMFGAIYYYKQWWKIFDKNQVYFSAMARPSKDLSFPEIMNFLKDFIVNLYRYQMKKKNPFYNLSELLYRRKMYILLLKIFEKIKKN